MKEVYNNLFVGSEKEIVDFGKLVAERVAKEFPGIINSFISAYYVHAAKEPWHRKALGYTTRGAPKDNSEYLFARRNNSLALNLVDVDESKAKFIPDELLDEAVKFIKWSLHEQFRPTFVHCNQGESRGPSIALMFLIEHTDFAEGLTFEEVELKYKEIYPNYKPNGIRMKTLERFNKKYKKS